MNFFQNIPFKHGFYGAMIAAIFIFLFMTLFKMTDAGFLTSFSYQLKGQHLLIGVNEAMSRRTLMSSQPMVWLVVILAVISIILAFINNKRKYTLIPMAGALSVVLLFLQTGNMDKFLVTPAYYLIMAIAALSSVHAWAHGQVSHSESDA